MTSKLTPEQVALLAQIHAAAFGHEVDNEALANELASLGLVHQVGTFMRMDAPCRVTIWTITGRGTQALYAARLENAITSRTPTWEPTTR